MKLLEEAYYEYVYLGGIILHKARNTKIGPATEVLGSLS